MTFSTRLLLVLAICSAFCFTSPAFEKAAETEAGWPQFGGPERTFKVAATGLADAWPPSGPPILWRRPLGDGYSGVVTDGNSLYTLYRDANSKREGDEVVICLDALTGQTRWEYRYPAPLPEKMRDDFGPGPHSTPLLVGNTLFTVGALARLHAFDKQSGRLLWARNLLEEFSMPLIGMKTDRGYASSPLPYEDTLILPVGSPGASVVAFRQSDGSVVWKQHSFRLTASSPILIRVGDQEQVVLFMATEVVGLDPVSGDLYWSFPHTTEFDVNVCLPVWGPDNRLFLSSAYDTGSRLLQLSREGEKTTARELWVNRKMQIHFGTAIRIGDAIYGSSGDFGPAFFSAVDVQTGDFLWRERGLAKSQFILADGKFLIVEEDGQLTLAVPSRDGLNVVSRLQLMNSRCWTAPTLLGKRLFVRDREEIVALDVGG